MKTDKTENFISSTSAPYMHETLCVKKTKRLPNVT